MLTLTSHPFGLSGQIDIEYMVMETLSKLYILWSIETYKQFPQLGRFAVRDMGMTVAVGVVTKLTKRKLTKEKLTKEKPTKK